MPSCCRSTRGHGWIPQQKDLLESPFPWPSIRTLPQEIVHEMRITSLGDCFHLDRSRSETDTSPYLILWSVQKCAHATSRYQQHLSPGKFFRTHWDVSFTALATPQKCKLLAKKMPIFSLDTYVLKSHLLFTRCPREHSSCLDWDRQRERGIVCGGR